MIHRGSFAIIGTVTLALLALAPGAASAAGPQPEPPAFGMLGITGFPARRGAPPIGARG